MGQWSLDPNLQMDSANRTCNFLHPPSRSIRLGTYKPDHLTEPKK